MPALGPHATHVELAKGSISEHLAIRAKGLFEDFPAVRHEQQRGPRRPGGLCSVGKTAIVQGRDDGLTRSGRGDD